MSDKIKHKDFVITITHGLDEDGDMIYNVRVDGELPYVYALGLLEAAKENLRGIYDPEVWE